MRTKTKTKKSFAPRTMGLGGAVRRVAMTMLLCLMLPMCMQTALAQESIGTEGDWEYTYAAGVAALYKYNGTATVVTTPTTLGGNAVRIISDYCFTGNDRLTSVTVSEGVVQIYPNSFMDCTQLESISLPSTLSLLGKYAFSNCSSLKAIALPSGMTHINEYTFEKCYSLETVSIPSSVRAMGKDAFAECHALTSVTLPAGVTEIEERTFVNCWNLATVKILGNITRIGTSAFSGCSNALTSITIPGSVTEIGEEAFNQCYQLANVYFDGSKAQWNAVTKGSEWNYGVALGFQEHWRCTLTYDMQGHGTAPAAQTVYSGTANVLTAPTAPTAQGYDFGGWYANAACTGTTFDFSTALDDNTTLYAKWTPRQNIITFDLGGKGTAISNQTVTTGNVVTEPDVQFEGNEGIEGWYTDSGLTQKYDFTAAVDQSMTLYAKWAAAGTATISVTNGEGGTATLTNAKGQTFNDGKVMPGVYTLTVTPQSGYSFTGSYTLTYRSSGISLPPTSISGGTARTYTLDLTEKNAAINVTFSTQPILTVTTRADDESVLSQVTWSVVNNQTTDTSYGNGDAIPFISDPNGAVTTDFGIRLSVDLGSLIGYAFTATVSDQGNGTTTKKNPLQEASFLIQPYGSIDIDIYVYESPVITLQDAADNSELIEANEGIVASSIVLQGRTLYKDGAWNTLCLPFDVGNFTGTPLEGATVMSLNTTKNSGTGFDEGTGVLTLNFTNATSIEAGKPYIVKWATTGQEISNPLFDDVTISRIKPQTVTSNDKKVSFMGTYDYIAFDTDDRSILYMGTENTLYWPKSGASIGAFRAYFQLTDPNVNASAIVLNFGDGETTGIGSIDNGELRIDNDDWYSLDGRRLNAKPTQRGVYIHNGKKVLVGDKR